MPDPDYCREIEAHLCRKNDGHLIRIAGPSFEIVSKWESMGVPLKVAFSGIDRYFERYYRNGPRRRPVRIDFCEADVLDVFDEWRRATGVSPVPAGSAGSGTTPVEKTGRRGGPSLPEHVERVITRLSSLRASGALDHGVDPLLDRLSTELDRVKTAGGLRGDARRDALVRLAQADEELIAIVTAAHPASVLEECRREALEELAAYRGSMAPDAFAEAVSRAAVHHMRQRLGLPTIAFAG